MQPDDNRHLMWCHRRIERLESALTDIERWAGMRCDDDVTREQNLAALQGIARGALAGDEVRA